MPSIHTLDPVDRVGHPSRRRFLAASAALGAGLTIGFAFPGGTAAAPEQRKPNPFEAYLRIAPDGAVTVYAAHMEMGQGCYTGMATLIAEELDADWSAVRVEGAAGNPVLYGNMAWGGKVQGTCGSTAMASSFDRYRQAGAAARVMLVAAAAEEWRLPADEIRVANGVLSHPSGRRATFGDLAVAAARQPVPQDPPLKQPEQWTKIGSESLRRLDSAGKVNGSEQYTCDVRLPGMLSAVIAHPPLFGAAVRSFDAGKAKAVPGVVDVVQTSRGIVVLARNTWAALQGRDALAVDWDDSRAEKRGSAEILAEHLRLAALPGEHTASRRGDASAKIGAAGRVIEATYTFPYLAHAALEPLNAVVARTGDGIEVWGGLQIPDAYQAMAAKIADVPHDKVRLHVMKTGGGFGRRAVPDGDVVVEAVEAAKAIDWRAPVALQWTREDDMRGGRYRPLVVHRVRVGLGADGAIAGWHQHVVGQSILIGTPFEAMLVKDGVDATSVEGASNLPYDIPDLHVETTNTRSGVPVLWWRSVGHTHTAYVVETMLDEIAAAGGTDPLVLRRRLLRDHARHRAVLDLAAEKAGWGTPLPPGRARGIAVHESFHTVVAQVAEITLDGGGGLRVDRVICAVDCGVAINPDQVRSQMEGGIGFGLGAVLREEVILEGGRVVWAGTGGCRRTTRV